MNTGGNNHARWHVSPRREQKQPDTRSSNEATEKFQRAKYTSERWLKDRFPSSSCGVVADEQSTAKKKGKKEKRRRKEGKKGREERILGPVNQL